MSRDKADTLLLLATCALVLLPHASHLPIWVLPICSALLAWRGWVTFRGNRMPPRWLLLPIAVLAMSGVYLTYRTFFGREAGVTMLALLLTLKLLEMHAKRDLFVVLFLSFFLILSSFFYSQSIGTAVMTLIATLAILTTQLSFQYTGVVPPLKQRIRLGSTIFLLAIPVTLVLFLLFPRIQGPLWGLPSDAQAGRTGLSETMAPGNISKLAQSDEIAFRAKFADPPPPQSQRYWRGVVLGAYDGRTWVPMPPPSSSSSQIAVKVRNTPLRYQVTLEPHGRRWIFALEVPQSISNVANSPVLISYDMQFLSSAPINERVRYDAVSYVDYALQANESARVLQQSLALPPGFNPRTLEWAADLRKRSANKAEMITAVLRLFQEQNFRYTLEPPPLGKHVIDEFLFTTRAGFCEHYSSAFVVLMRALGIPARVVTGYQGGEINPTDGFMIVRQSDAHAWAEVWLEERGWIRVDPTAAVAPNRVEQNLSRAVSRSMLGGLITLDGSSNSLLTRLRQLRQNWDALTNAWNQWVLNYTPEQQRNFVRSLGFHDVSWRTLIVLMLLFGVIAVAVAVLPLLLHRQKRDPFDIVYQVLCRRLEKKGLPRAIHEGPRAYGARLTAVNSPLSTEQKTALAQFLELYETVRYGPTDTPSSASLTKLKTLLAECR